MSEEAKQDNSIQIHIELQHNGEFRVRTNVDHLTTMGLLVEGQQVMLKQFVQGSEDEAEDESVSSTSDKQ